MGRCAKRNRIGCDGPGGDLEVKVLYKLREGKC